MKFAPTGKGRLSGRVIVVDPGHDIGNSSHLREINRTYWVGLRKICNTTGTATNAGYPESTYAFDVAARLRRLLTAQGATVILTRDRNTRGTYGPCIGARGTLAAQQGAELMVAVHADGAPASGRGFHIIGPKLYPGYTDDIYAGSKRLAKAMVAGMVATGLPRSTYLSRTDPAAQGHRRDQHVRRPDHHGRDPQHAQQGRRAARLVEGRPPARRAGPLRRHRPLPRLTPRVTPRTDRSARRTGRFEV